MKAQPEPPTIEKSDPEGDLGAKGQRGLPVVADELNQLKQELRKKEELKKFPQIGAPLKTAEIKQAMQGLKKNPRNSTTK